jgi:electron transfer flavoprotein alpha subunit
MTARIFAYIVHKAGVVDDSAAELFAAAKTIDPASSPTAVVVGAGPDHDVACNCASTIFPEVWKIAGENLSYPNAELVRQALVKVLPPGCIVLIPHNHFGIDLAPGLSIKLNAAYVSDIVGIGGVANYDLKVERQEFGGQVSTHVRCNIANGAVINVRPGAFKPLAAAPLSGTVVDKSTEVGALTPKRRYVTTISSESGDVDITKEAVLVSIGRGIGEKDNITIAEELAEALGGVVSCSRPVIDAKWLPKSRQVGSSGQTVKPKVYLACGISGSFQHLAGIKGNPFIVAINKNPKAPIFQIADVGIVTDMLEFMPELAAKVREAKKVAV